MAVRVISNDPKCKDGILAIGIPICSRLKKFYFFKEPLGFPLNPGQSQIMTNLSQTQHPHKHTQLFSFSIQATHGFAMAGP